MRTEFLWCEKYRPKTIEECILPDDMIYTFTAYKMYVASKPWVKDNYLLLPNRKPEWI